MTYDPDNIFAKILRGEIPCDKVYEDAHVLAFHDITPQAPVHILVIPKGAFTSIDDFGKNANPDEIKGFFAAIDTITAEKDLKAAGFRCIANMGAHAHQTVPHFHMHILGGEDLGSALRGKP